MYHNIAIAIDPGRQLFNGAPGVIALAIDALALQPGAHVLHIAERSILRVEVDCGGRIS